MGEPPPPMADFHLLKLLKRTTLPLMLRSLRRLRMAPVTTGGL